VTITKNWLQVLRADLQAALTPVATKHKVALTVGGITYSPTEATIKLEVATIEPDGTVNTKEVAEFKRHAQLFGLEPDDLNRTIQVDFGWQGRKEPGTIVGIKPRSVKYPILVRRESSGKLFKLPLDRVLRALGRPAGWTEAV